MIETTKEITSFEQDAIDSRNQVDEILKSVGWDFEKDFKDIIGNRIEKICKVEYAFQELDDLPEGFTT